MHSHSLGISIAMLSTALIQFDTFLISLAFPQLPGINVWLVEVGDPAGVKLLICLLLPT